MNDKKLRLPGTVALLLGFAALYVILLLTAVHAVGTDGDLYYDEQMKAGVLPASGLTDADLRMLDGRLAGFLAGDDGALDAAGADYSSGTSFPEIVSLEVFGVTQPAFNPREMDHLLDCYDLFALVRKVRSRLIPWAVLLIVGGAYVLQDRRRVRLCAWLSPLVLLVPLGAFAVYAAANFDAAFTLFHKTLFKNDLWLLDPRTDLLIRICPESMFMHMGARIGVYSLIAMLAVSAAATLLTFIRPRRRGDDTWNNRDMRRASAQKRIDFGNRAGR